ncbi:nmrA-like family protein [Penicillium odoratum]|uniref:nmrA-like family protein n=1 Tax=Penicillium odoratum TaxID=1167516 RepID=UPI0025481D7E|nr:nmrA-like family protein [Penicillium odoratum]KAJ5760223.1 nmrA-like family protein [Penicillium odoratum]
MTKVILVTGATGKQGGSVIDALLDQTGDIEILALTRNANSVSAQKLLNKSDKVKLVEGNLDQPDAIFENARKATDLPIWGVFSVLVPIPGGKEDLEERQGKAMVDMALKNKVKYFVYTSVDRGGEASIDNPTLVPHFINKHNIEHHLMDSAKNTEMNWTILRPTAFIDNLVPDFFGKMFTTSWKIAVKEKPLQVIAVSDIGFFGAQAFLKPDIYRGKCVSLAGDSLTYDEMARIFKNKTGQDVPTTFGFLSRLLMWMMKDFGYMFQWFYDSGYNADIQALRKVHPGLKDFSTWLDTESVFTTTK